MATRGPISIPPFEDRADLQRFANSHLTNFDPPSIVLPIDFHRASSPSRSDIDLFFLQCQCFSINILQFYRANWSYGGEFFLYLKPGPTKTGSSSEIIVFPPHKGRVRRSVFFLFVSKYFSRNFASSRDGVIAGEKKRGDASSRERWCFGSGRPWKQRA